VVGGRSPRRPGAALAARRRRQVALVIALTAVQFRFAEKKVTY